MEETYFEFHVQEFKRKKWRTISVHQDLLEADHVANHRALRTLELIRVVRIEYSPVKTFLYAR